VNNPFQGLDNIGFRYSVIEVLPPVVRSGMRHRRLQAGSPRIAWPIGGIVRRLRSRHAGPAITLTPGDGTRNGRPLSGQEAANLGRRCGTPRPLAPQKPRCAQIQDEATAEVGLSRIAASVAAGRQTPTVERDIAR